ncbi:MAG: Sua5/YciO/YrdC/YwlC family protein [Anaerolineae bacterium]|nr:Sua5/YciO/YrdC/YwlC family protein [Anaerolineae bacterium]
MRAGQIVAVKGLGGFHLMVDAGNATAIERLRERKPRRDKPFALMARDMDAARRLVHVSPEAEALLTSAEAPIVLLPRRDDAPVADAVATASALLRWLGRRPATTSKTLVATSGNLSDEPICTDEHEAVERLGHIADLFLVHDRPIERHVDDSVAWIVVSALVAAGAVARAVLRGQPARDPGSWRASQEHGRAVSVGRQVFVSQHIGDLETPEALAAFERVIADFLRLYEAQPVAIAHDMHPEYLSTWAQERKRAEGN